MGGWFQGEAYAEKLQSLGFKQMFHDFTGATFFWIKNMAIVIVEFI